MTTTTEIPTAHDEAEHARRMQRFPLCYGLWCCAVGERGRWRAQLRGFGGVILWTGRLFNEWLDANASTIPVARKMVAAKIREVRKLPRRPAMPRLAKRVAARP